MSTSSINGFARVDAPDFLDGILLEWEQSDDAPSVLSVCHQYPQIRENRPLFIKLAYEEFRLRRKRGEELDAVAYCQQFAGFEHEVGRMLSVHAAMEQHPSWLAELTAHLEKEAEEFWPVPGSEFLRFNIVREIGRGGLARVYLAQEQVVGNRLVVLKVSIRDSGEARIMGRLQHPGIMPILQVDFDPLSELHVVVMPFLGTTTVYDVLKQAFPNRKGPLPGDAKFIRQLAESGRDGLETPVLAGRSLFDSSSGSYLDAVIELGAQLAEALAYTHARGVLHRDLKPSNILVTPQGLALLMDFNLSARTDGPGLLVGGTIPYMPPELLTALSGSESVRLTSSLPSFGSTWNTISKEECATNDLRCDSTNRGFGGWIACADPRSDLFSWGVILYEMLTGQLPFGEPDVRQPVKWQAEWVLKRQVDRTIERHSANQHIPEGLFEIVRDCLAVDPDARPSSASLVVEALRRLRTPAEVAPAPEVAEVAAATLPALASAATADSPEALATEPVKATDAAADLARTSRRRWIVGAAALAVPTLAYVVWNSPLVSPHSQLDALNTAQLIDAKFLFESAKKLARDGKWPEAIWRLQRAAELDGGNGENFAIQAYCLLQQNNIAGGSDLGRSAIEANYSNSAVLNNYGYALLKDRRFDLAASNLRAALKMAPNEAAIHHNFAILMLAEEHPKEAVRHIRRALELHPADSMELHRSAAQIFAEVAAPGSPLEQDAIQHLEAAIRAGLDRRTLASGKGNLERILKLVKEKDASNLGTRDLSASSVRLMYPSANHSALPSVALLKP